MRQRRIDNALHVVQAAVNVFILYIHRIVGFFDLSPHAAAARVSFRRWGSRRTWCTCSRAGRMHDSAAAARLGHHAPDSVRPRSTQSPSTVCSPPRRSPPCHRSSRSSPPPARRHQETRHSYTLHRCRELEELFIVVSNFTYVNSQSAIHIMDRCIDFVVSSFDTCSFY